MCVCVLVTQLCLTLCSPTDCSLPDFFVHGILQVRILEWVAFPFSKGSSQLRDQTLVSCITGGFLTSWATRETQEYWSGFSSVQFSHSVMSYSLWPHELQHARPLCPSPTPRVYPNSCPLTRWCHPTISSSPVPFSSCLQSFPASGSFKWVSSSHQVAKVPGSTSVLPMNIQDWFL